MQDKNVSQFDRHVSAGIQLSGRAFNRDKDVLGVGVGLTMISDAYKKASGFDSNELYAEAYYNMAVKEGFYVTPDIQYISNPGGNSKEDAFLTYGVRAGVMFLIAILLTTKFLPAIVSYLLRQPVRYEEKEFHNDTWTNGNEW